MQVRVVHSLEDLRELGPAWKKLYDEDPCADVFADIDYYTVWWEHFRHGIGAATLVTRRSGHLVGVGRRGAQMHVLAVEDNGEIVGVLPLVRVPGKWNGLPVRILAPTINGHSPRGGVLSARLTDDAFRALAEHLADSPDWDVMILDGIRLDSDFVHKFSKAVSSRGIAVVEQRPWGHAFLKIEGTWNEFLASQGRSFRASLDRWRSGLEKLGPVRVERYAGSDVRKAMQILVEVDRSSWKASGGESLAFNPKLAAYYQELAVRLAAKDKSEVWILTINQEPAAAICCLRKGDVLYMLKTSYSDSFASASVSPGNHLLARIMESCWERGIRGVDFMIMAAFVERWTPERTEIAHAMIYNRRFYPTLVRFSESLRGGAGRARRALGGAAQWRHRAAKRKAETPA
jgi:CelD/BcsL family acetyltransferase involved in cellulose biosynthesis